MRTKGKHEDIRKTSVGKRKMSENKRKMSVDKRKMSVDKRKTSEDKRKTSEDKRKTSEDEMTSVDIGKVNISRHKEGNISGPKEQKRQWTKTSQDKKAR